MVVPTLGLRRDWLKSAIRSVLAQEGVGVTVRVVAPTTAKLSLLCGELGVELLESDRKGLSAAINDGWNAPSKAEYVSWLGDDDLLAPGSLSAAIRALEGRPAAAMVYGAVRYIDARGETLWVQRPGRFAAWYLAYGKNLLPQQGSLLRMSRVQSVGGVDERFTRAMDQDLFSRLILGNGESVYVGRELAAFRLHESNITLTKGISGDDEGEIIRARHTGNLYPAVRRLTRVLDHAIYSVIRHLPFRPPAEINGVPYTIV